MLDHFRDIAFDKSETAIFGYPSGVYSSLDGGVIRDDIRKILPGCQGMANAK